MDTIISLIGTPLGYLMSFCYFIIRNYGLSIVLFTMTEKRKANNLLPDLKKQPVCRVSPQTGCFFIQDYNFCTNRCRNSILRPPGFINHVQRFVQNA